MKFGVPWSVKGIRPEARETAKEAARRSGMSLGEWLNSVILQQAARGRRGGAARADDDDSDGDELSGVHAAARRPDAGASSNSPAPAPRPTRPNASRNDSGQIADLIGRLDRRLDQFVNASRQPGDAPSAAAQRRRHCPERAGMPPALDLRGRRNRRAPARAQRPSRPSEPMPARQRQQAAVAAPHRPRPF